MRKVCVPKFYLFLKKQYSLGVLMISTDFLRKMSWFFKTNRYLWCLRFVLLFFWWFNIRIRLTSFVLSYFFFNLRCNELKKMCYNFPNKTAICSKLAVKVEPKEKVVYVLATFIKRCWSLKQSYFKKTLLQFCSRDFYVLIFIGHYKIYPWRRAFLC